MDELIYRILKEIENGTNKTSINDLHINQEQFHDALEEIEDKQYLLNDCFAHAKNKPYILFAKNAQLTKQGILFLRNYENNTRN